MFAGSVAGQNTTRPRNWRHGFGAREERIRVKAVQDKAAVVGRSQAVQSLCPTGNRKSLEGFKHRKDMVRFVFLKDHSDYYGAEKVMW